MKTKLLIGACAFVTLTLAQTFQGWAFNSFLEAEFFGNPTNYATLVTAGEPCYAWVGGGRPDSAQPSCPYDPSNTNPGWQGSRSHEETKKK